MEQFSHDLSVALEESRITGSRNGRWTARRRTRSTGNLPCAPQPTEDSSSSPEDGPTLFNNGPVVNINGESQVLSDSDNGATGGAGGQGGDGARSAIRFPLAAVRPDVSLGNFESDSLNETFSPARPCARRKRKFKRMAVEYDTTNAPLANNSTRFALAAGNLFSGDNPSRVGCLGSGGGGAGGGIGAGGHSSGHKHSSARFGTSCQENFRANMFFCGKRKRSHRDRYDYDHHRTSSSVQHSSSVPRGQRDMFSSSSCATTHTNATGRNSFLEHIHRNRLGSVGAAATSNATSGDLNAKIQPLNKNIISRIERIAQDSVATTTTTTAAAATSAMGPLRVPRPECEFKPIDPATMLGCNADEHEEEENTLVAGDVQITDLITATETNNNISIPGAALSGCKTGSLESNFSFQEYGSCSGNSGLGGAAGNPGSVVGERSTKRHHTRRHHRHKRSAMRMQLQFDDPSFMDCPMADILSSSSLSSSDSETDKTCDSDREGDDELTDWPGNEGTVTFPNVEFKRTKSQKMSGLRGGGGGSVLPLIKSDEDTRMSAEEVQVHGMNRMQPVVLPLKPGFVPVTSVTPPGFLNRATPSLPIDMPMNNVVGGGMSGGVGGVGGGGVVGGMIIGAAVGGCGGMMVGGGMGGPQIESELSGETSNHFLSSPNANALNEVREFRAGCRRVREERPSFSVITSVNEELSRFLQDGRQTQLHLPDADAVEHEKLSHLAKLYSLNMRVDRGMAILTKTSNTTQPVRVDHRSSMMAKRYLSDFKRRCYEEEQESKAGGGGGCAEMGAGSAAMATEEQDMNDIQS